MAYCDLATDLTDVFSKIHNFQGNQLLENWTATSGQTYTYQKSHVGYVEKVYENGALLTVATSIATVEATAARWWYDSTVDILYIHPTGDGDPADFTIEAGVDWDDYLTRCRDDAQEFMDARLNKIMITPLIERVRSDHSSNAYELDIRRACAALTCYFAISRRFPGNDDAMRVYKIAWNPEPEPGEVKGILNDYLEGTIVRQDDVTQREAFSGNIWPTADNTTPEPGILIEGQAYVDTFQEWLLTITTGGAPGTAKYTLSLDGGTTDSYTGQDTRKTGSNLFVPLAAGLQAYFPQATYTQDDTWTIQVYPMDSTLEAGSKIGNISLVR
jgi:hypothetical protein